MLIGNKIREIRRQQNMTLSQLSEKSGVQMATLSRIENNKMVGTLDSHINIAKALGIDVTQLYSNIIREEKKAEAHTTKSTGDIFIHNEKSSYEILTSKLFSKKMMPTLVKIDSQGQTTPEENPLGSEKFVFVLEGQIEVQLTGETYSLSKNNSLYFDASLKHCLINRGAKPAKVLCIVTPVVL